jgi:DNA-binding NtrC family response regulator
VRELENAIGHAAMMAAGPVMEISDFPAYLSSGEGGFGSPLDRIPLPADLTGPASDFLEEFEYRLIQQALNDCKGNQMRAARMLRTTRDRLRYRMKKYGLHGPTDDQDNGNGDEQAAEAGREVANV